MTLPTDPAENLAALIRCASVTPAEGGALTALETMLKPLGFLVDRPVFSEDGTPDIENLYARRSGNGPHLMFAGHTDVVPVGDEAAWTHPPFGAEIANGEMYGRGAVDMKGGIACFIAAVARHVEANGGPKGSVSLLITGDEEGPAINGTVKLLEWAASRGEKWDASIVGEPTNPDALGDMIKIGRRGSMSGAITVNGRQGHVAYPQLADNPVRGLMSLVDALLHPVFDKGTTDFQPTNLEVTTIDVGNPATNVIPAKATATFNIRFNDTWTAETVQAEIHNRLDQAARRKKYRIGKKSPVDYDLVWRDRPSHVFLTRDDRLIETLRGSIKSAVGKEPTLSTSGGTSDARFIKDYCPVVEFGLVGKTMHMVDERVAIADLETLTQIYQRFIEDWFGQGLSMLTADETQASLTGAWRLMLGKADGLRLLDLSADGFWNSFFAIIVAAPALIVGWVGIANEIGDPDAFAGRFSMLVRLATVDLGSWVLPLIALALVAPRAGIGGRFVHYVVASNWASAITAWLMLPSALVRLVLSSASQVSSLVSLVLFALSMVLTWRMTNATIGKGAAVGTAVFVGMFIASLLVLFGLQMLLGITVPDDVGPQSLSGLVSG